MSASPDVQVLLAHAGFVRALAAALLGEGADADDAAQDVWLRALRARPAMAGSSLDSQRGWLARVLGNVVHNRRRADARRRRHEHAVAVRDEALPSVAELAAREAVRQRVVRAVLDLSEPHRTLIMLRYYEGRSAAAIARHRGRASSTVRTQLREGLAMLRRRLDDDHAERRAEWMGALAGWMPRNVAGPVVLLATRKTMTVAAVVLLAVALGTWAVLGVAPSKLPPAVPPAVLASDGGAPHAIRQADDAAPPPQRSLLAAAAAPSLLRGLVLSPSDAPVEGARIQITREPRGSHRFLHVAREPVAVATLTTGADGRFSIPLPRAVVHEVTVRAAGYGTVALAGYGGQDVVVRLQRAAVIEGRITIAATGAPIEGARVGIGDERGEEIDETSTARGGWYRLDHAGPGRLRLWVRTSEGAFAVCNVVAVAGESVRQDVAIELRRHLVGRVVEAGTGTPLAGAEVGDGTFMVTTGPDGRYRIVDVDASSRSAEWQLVARAAGHSEVKQWVDEGDGTDGDRQVDFALPLAGAVRGRIVDEDGDPIVGADVVVMAAFAVSIGTDLISRATTTDARGRYVVADIDGSRRQVIWVHAEGFGARTYRLPALVPAGGTLDAPDVTLHRGSVLEGRVEDTAGRPVAEAAVLLRGCNADWRSWAPDDTEAAPYAATERQARADAEGQLRFADLAEGAYELTVSVPGGARATTAVAVPRADIVDDLRITVDLGLSIEGLVRDQRGEPTERVYLRVTPLDGQPAGHPLASAPGGRFAIRALAKGRYRLHVEALEPELGLPQDVECAAGTHDLIVTLARAAEIAGTVSDERGEPFVGRVKAVPTGAPFGPARTADVDAHGRFTLRVPEGQAVDLEVLALVRAGPMQLSGETTSLLTPSRALMPPIDDLHLRVRR